MRGIFLIALLAGLVGCSGSTTKRLRKSNKAKSPLRKLQEGGIIEVEEYTCSSVTNNFKTSVIIDFNSDVTRFGATFISELEELFKQSYSEVNFALCDAPYFRTISDVSIEIMTEISNIVVENDREIDLNHYLKVNIDAECRDCTKDAIFSGKGKQILNSPDITKEDLVSVVAYKNLGGEEVAEATKGNSSFAMESCVCPAGITPSQRMPTESEFYEIFNKAIMSLLNSKNAEQLQVYEVEELECSSNTTEVSSDVYVRLDGDLSQLDENGIKELEEAFVATYNDLNFEFCDYPYFRTINKATLDTSWLPAPSNSRKLQENDVPSVYLDFNETVLLVDPPYNASILKFTLFAECKGNCGSETSLFSSINEAKYKPVFAIADALNGQTNDMHGSSSTCFCPTHPKPLMRSPTTEEFVEAFNITLENGKQDGSTPNLVLEDVLEVKDVNCNFNETDFTSSVFVNLDQPLEILTEDEISVIEEMFRESYNALTFATCDKFFRQLEDVRLVTNKVRRRELQSNETSRLTNITEEQFPAAFSVRGTCRNCPVNDNGSFELFDDIFEDSVRRALTEGKAPGPHSFHSRKLQGSKMEKCACPADVTPGSLAPTGDAFLDILNMHLTAYENAEILTSFGKIADVVEVSDRCNGESFVSYMSKYDLEVTGNCPAVEDEVLTEAFRLAYNKQRPHECDPLLSAVSVENRDVPYNEASITDFESLTSIFFVVSSLQTDGGSICQDGKFTSFAVTFNAVMEGLDSSCRIESCTLEGSPLLEEDLEGRGGTKPYSSVDTEAPTLSPTFSPTFSPTYSPSASPSSEPSASPSAKPSAMPTQNRAMCNYDVTSLTDYVIIDYAISRVADLNIDLPIDMPDFWPLQEPATLIAAEEYIAAYNSLQKNQFCDPFKRKIVDVTCTSITNQILSGRLCCTVHFKCMGNCEEFIYPDRDPIGAFYDQPGFGYPTDKSCVCHKNAPDRAPSFQEHFNKINDSVPWEVLSFDFKGFSSKQCPR